MAIIAGQINPSLYALPDYSGVTRAAEMQVRNMANIGDQIAGTIDKYGEMKKQQAEQNRQVKQAENIGNLIIKTMPEYADMIKPSLVVLADQNIPLADRVTEALNITEGFKTRLNLEGLKREREMDALRMQKIQSSMQPTATATTPTSFFDQ